MYGIFQIIVHDANQQVILWVQCNDAAHLFTVTPETMGYNSILRNSKYISHVLTLYGQAVLC